VRQITCKITIKMVKPLVIGGSEIVIIQIYDLISI